MSCACGLGGSANKRKARRYAKRKGGRVAPFFCVSALIQTLQVKLSADEVDGNLLGNVGVPLEVVPK